eukprot:350380-Chlamydomonas_euryale.AAC.3
MSRRTSCSLPPPKSQNLNLVAGADELAAGMGTEGDTPPGGQRPHLWRTASRMGGWDPAKRSNGSPPPLSLAHPASPRCCVLQPRPLHRAPALPQRHVATPSGLRPAQLHGHISVRVVLPDALERRRLHVLQQALAQLWHHALHQFMQRRLPMRRHKVVILLQNVQHAPVAAGGGRHVVDSSIQEQRPKEKGRQQEGD